MLSTIKTLLACSCLFWSAVLAQTPKSEIGPAHMGQLKTQQVKPGMVFLRDRKAWVQKVKLPSILISYVLQVRALGDINSDSLLSITDGSGQLSKYENLLNLKGLRRGQKRLSQVLRIESGYDISIEIKGVSSTEKPQLKFEIILLDSIDSAPLAGIPDGEALISNETYVELGKSVARLIFPAGSCTGFAITNNLLLTNNHCVAATNKLCDELAIEFNAIDRSVPGNNSQCLGLVSSDSLLDYALVRFESSTPVPPLNLFFEPIPNTRVEYSAIHHPWGQDAILSTQSQILGLANPDMPSQATVLAARKACRLEDYTFAETSPAQYATTLSHRIDTDPGSSGSPIIFDRRVLALHFDMDRRLYLRGWSRPESIKFDCLKARAGYTNWATDLCAVLRHAAKNAPKEEAVKKLAATCKR